MPAETSPAALPFPFPSRRRQLFILAALAIAAYGPTLRGGFLWDDHVIIVQNPALRSWSLETLANDFRTDNTRGTGDNYYRPLQALSHRIDYTIWGLRPFGFHLTSLLFHIGNAWLLRALSLALGFSPLTALIAASLFAVHPIGVEQFIIPSGRGTPISYFFALWTLLLLLRRTRTACAGAMLTFLTGLFFKEYTLGVPLLYGLVLWTRREHTPFRWIWPGLAGCVLAYLLARHAAVGEALGSTPPKLTIQFLLWAFPRTVFHYVELMWVPWNLHSHRLIPRLSVWWPLWLAASTGLLAWIATRRDRRPALFAGWLIMNLLPAVPQMAKGGFMLDHWGYPALPALLWPLAMGVAWCWTQPRRWIAIGLGGLFFPLLIGWALIVHLNVQLRGTDERMYRWALRFTTSNPIRFNLGVLLLETGRAEESIELLEAVRHHYPEDVSTLYALAAAYDQLGHPNTAIQYLNDALRLKPDFAAARQALGALRRRHPPAAQHSS